MKIEVKHPTAEEIKMAESWPTWEKEPSEFSWKYDRKETCLILEGAAEVISDDGNESAGFGKGDWVIFESGLSCVWKISQKIKKRYKFGD
ncbi:MAG: cupin domain-containing protein [Parcubacteria group bacterium]|jgi:hypothetical protein